jgi:hypothetical protein
MHDDKVLMDIHTRLLFTHDEDGHLLNINEPDGGGPAARLFLGRTQHGHVWRFHAGLPDTKRTELTALCADEPVSAEITQHPFHAEAYMRLLDAPITAGPAYWLPDAEKAALPDASTANIDVLTIDDTHVDTSALARVFDRHFGWLLRELPTWQPCASVLLDGHAVSICRSVRMTAEAHEGGVETAPEWRGCGFAKLAVAHWARAVAARSRAPFYSTSWGNSASQALARSLGFVQFGVDFEIF